MITNISARLRVLACSERGELGAATKLIIIFFVLALVGSQVIAVEYTKYSVRKGAEDSAKGAATEFFSTRDIGRARAVASDIATGNGADIADFRYFGGVFFVKLNSRTKLEYLARYEILRHYIVTSATAEATVPRGN